MENRFYVSCLNFLRVSEIEIKFFLCALQFARMILLTTARRNRPGDLAVIGIASGAEGSGSASGQISGSRYAVSSPPVHVFYACSSKTFVHNI